MFRRLTQTSSLLLPNRQKRWVSLRDLKTRMRAVRVIQKITTSMKAVAASKLKAAEKEKDQVKPFYHASVGLLKNLPPPQDGDIKQIFCSITSDRGLCGSANSSVAREIVKTVTNYSRDKLHFYCIGEKGRATIARTQKENMRMLMTDLDKKKVSLVDMLPFVENMLAIPNIEKLSIVCNKYINPITFKTESKSFPSKVNVMANLAIAFKGVEIQGDEKQIAGDLYDYAVAATLYASLIESIAVELGSRMMAMDNASKNAGEMIGRLTQEYNTRRQAAITKELTEIVSGAEAIVEEIED